MVLKSIDLQMLGALLLLALWCLWKEKSQIFLGDQGIFLGSERCFCEKFNIG